MPGVVVVLLVVVLSVPIVLLLVTCLLAWFERRVVVEAEPEHTAPATGTSDAGTSDAEVVALPASPRPTTRTRGTDLDGPTLRLRRAA